MSKKKTKFVIWSPGANCEEYVANNIISIASQTYDNFLHVVCNDASKDNTTQVIKSLQHDKMVVYENNKHHNGNKGWLWNAITYLSQHVDDDCIIVSVDLDDWLAHNRVLEYIKNVYDETDAWITYGSVVTCHGGGAYDWEPNHKYDEEVWKDRLFRRRLNFFSHLRTFRGFLWNNINKQDLQCYTGKYEKFSSDVAYSLPILDMTPSHKVVHLDDPLYFYNFMNPRNDSKIDMVEQRRQGDWFRQKNQYNLLDENTKQFINK